MKQYVWRLAWFLASSLAFSALAFSQTTYDSLAEAVDTARAQAYVYLSKGTFIGKAGTSEISWIIPNDQVARVSFFYGAGTLQDAKIDFGTSPTFATMQDASGSCTRFQITTIFVGPGGFIDPKSDIVMRPDSSCTMMDSGFQTQIGLALAVNPLAKEFFKGSTFAGRLCRKGTPNCSTASAITTKTGPVARVVLFTTTDANGIPTMEAFAVRLKPDQVMSLPDGNFVAFAPGSQIAFASVDYDVPNQSGKALVEQIAINVKNANLTFGSTALNLAAGSSLLFAGMTIEQSTGIVQMRGGSITGTVGDGSIVRLESSTARESLLSIQNATVQLSGIDISYTKGKSSFSGGRGFFELTTKASRLAFSDDVLLLLQSGNLRLNLSCPTGSPSDCQAFKWSSDGAVVVRGTIPGAAVHLARGGYISFPGQNKLAIESGQLLTDILTLDTENKSTPISGKLQNLDLRLAAQDWVFDPTTSVKAASFTLTSQALELSKDDRFPIGEAKFQATITDLTAKGLGNIRFASASGTVDITVRRALGDDPKLEGTVAGKLAVSPMQLESNAAASLRLYSIKYYRGYGTAKLDFSIDSANAIYRTPYETREEGVPGGKFDMTGLSLPIQVALTAPIAFSGMDVSVDNALWKAGDAKSLPIGIRITMPGTLAATAQHYFGNTNLGYTASSCSPEVKSVGANYQISGYVDLIFSGQPKVITTRNFAIDRPIDADLDASDCKAVAFITCGLLGSIGGPTLGVAAALACGKVVDDAKAKFQGDMRDKTYEFVNKLNFSATL